MRFDQLAEITGGRLLHSNARADRFTGVSIDSRTIKAGELFVAIRGEVHDGHDFIGQAVTRGAGGLMVENRHAGTLPEGASVGIISVDNTHVAMMALARDYRNRSEARFVAITGSNGKTTTKELTYHLVRASEPHTYRSPGNLNNLFGAPLALFGMPADAAVSVMELGISTPGEMTRLAQLVQPDLVAITNIGPSHLEYLGSVEEVARAKLELIRACPETVPLIINADDAILTNEARQVRSQPITFGLDQPSDFKVGAIEHNESGATEVTIDGYPFLLTLAGRHQVYNLLAAYAITRTLGYEFAEVDTLSLQLASAPMRGEVVRKNGISCFADCYNANPDSVRAGLQTYFETPHQGRRIVILGEMLELGAQSERYHRDIGRLLATYEFDLAAFVGKHARFTMEEVLAANDRERIVQYYADAQECAGAMAEYFQDGDFVFLKASRGVGLEAVLSVFSFATEAD